MIFENTSVMNFENALRGMRNPMNSWDKSDSYYGCDRGYTINKSTETISCKDCMSDFECNCKKEYIIGENDMKLAQKLIRAGSEHRKFMRQIFVSVDITAPLYFWKELDTYKIATTRNSCSTMHKIHVKQFEISDFTHDAIDKFDFAKDTFEKTLLTLEQLRKNFNNTDVKNKEDEVLKKTYWRAMIQMLPDSYKMKATLTLNYENLLGICSVNQRRNHKLNEWSGKDNPDLPNFIAWARKLPYAQELIFIDENN
jgi:hypothetical protein